MDPHRRRLIGRRRLLRQVHGRIGGGSNCNHRSEDNNKIIEE